MQKKPKHPVLIVEDTKDARILLENICQEMEIKYNSAVNGQEALDLCKKTDFSVYIVDLMLPVMDGKTFITELKKIKQNPIILIESALDTSDMIIEVMKLGVFDFVIKPIDPDVFKSTLMKSLEFHYLKELESFMIAHETQKLKGQLEWLNYKDTRKKTSADSSEKSSIYNLKTSLSQGHGLGTTVTLIDMLASTLTPSGDQYLVDKTFMDLLVENNKTSRRILESLNLIVDLMDQKTLELDWIELNELLKQITKRIETESSFLSKKGMHLIFPAPNFNIKVQVNLEILFLAVEELVINAFKYGKPKSTIYFFVNKTGGYLCLTIKNDIDIEPYGGIPPEMEKLVLEPFFRIHPPVEEALEFEKFGLGLGLTIVDYIMRKHNGLFFIHDAVDHMGATASNCVLAEMFLPLDK